MRISDVDAIAIDIPLKKNFGGSTYSVLKRSTVITRLRTQEGLVSEVYNGDNREAGPEIVRLIRDELAPLVKGESIFATERMWQKMFALTYANRDRKTLLEAIACIDCAAWDLVAKASGRSMRELLGGIPRQGADHIDWRLLHGGQDPRRYRPRDGGLPAGRHGRLQVQGRGPVTEERCGARRGGARSLRP